MSRQHRYLGAYGVCRWGDHVLLVRKARGPYTGLLDLPGGGIGFGEEPEAALRREFIEETGLTVTASALLRAASKVVRHVAEDGVVEELHHLGLIYEVAVHGHGGEVVPAVKLDADGKDSNGAAWVPVAELDVDVLTPFAVLALFGTESGEPAR